MTKKNRQLRNYLTFLGHLETPYTQPLLTNQNHNESSYIFKAFKCVISHYNK